MCVKNYPGFAPGLCLHAFLVFVSVNKEPQRFGVLTVTITFKEDGSIARPLSAPPYLPPCEIGFNCGEILTQCRASVLRGQ